MFSVLIIIFKLIVGKSLGNFSLKSNPYSEIVVFADFPTVPLVVNSNFSPDLKMFLLINEVSKAIPISSIFECFRSKPNLNEYFYLGTKNILASYCLSVSFT